MSKKGHDRYGSPYSPSFKGTGKTTASHEAQSAPNRKEAVRMNEEHNKSRTGTMRITGFDQHLLDQMLGGDRSRDADMFRRIFSMHTGGIIREPERSKQERAYLAARENVDSWLVSADETAFDQIKGNDAALGKLRDAITGPVQHAKLYEAYGMKAPKGALLYGPPGCGKTMFARAAATEMTRLYPDTKVEFLSVAGTELQSGYVGQTEIRIKAIFAFARAYRDFKGHPLLVFIDEADALLPSREGGRPLYGWEESRVSTFLAEMDGVRESGAFVLLATNRPDAIDQAVLRDGRCDFKIEIKRPNRQAIEAILSSTFASVPLNHHTRMEDVLFAALEGLLDPEKIIMDARLMQIGKKRTLEQIGGRSMLLEHILSGAMVASVARRSTAHAFARDKALGVFSGVTLPDVLAAANDLYEENKNLDHSYAIRDFLQEAVAELEAEVAPQGRLKH